MANPIKYDLYENSVQTPVLHVQMFSTMFQEIRKTPAKQLREDFCGTFLLSCHWVRQNPKNTALCLDIDPEPLEYGKKKHWARLTDDQKQRINLGQANVLKSTRIKNDLIVGCNFSFFVFKERELLLQYFKSALKSLNSKGLLILEMAGGPGMITTPSKEQRTIYRTPKEKFVYVWEQKSFDPIDRTARYAIHFKLQNGTVLKNAFTYDWRLWTIPEIRDAMKEAGFKDTCVYWETSHQGEGTGEYARIEQGDNAFAWIAYVIGIK